MNSSKVMLDGQGFLVDKIHYCMRNSSQERDWVKSLFPFPLSDKVSGKRSPLIEDGRLRVCDCPKVIQQDSMSEWRIFVQFLLLTAAGIQEDHRSLGLPSATVEKEETGKNLLWYLQDIGSS